MTEKPRVPARTLSLPHALERGLKELPVLTDADAALVQLARRYVVDLEEGADTWRVGPRLLDCLRELRMTPAARSSVKAATPAEVTGGGDSGAPSPADQLAQRRAASRERRAPAMDASTP